VKLVSSNAPLNVLFLCTGNSARSIMGGCILNRLGAGKFHSFNAGSQPRGTIDPPALAVLRKSNFDVSQLRSRSWDEFEPRRGAEARFRRHRLRRRGEGGLSHLAGQPMTRSLGLARSRQSGRNRSRSGACLRGLLPHVLSVHQYLRELALRPLKQAVAASGARPDRQDA
jgi:Low molecular weight phosphotyrosine protein phosphatase